MENPNVNFVKQQIQSGERTLVVHSDEELTKVEEFIDQLYEEYDIREDVYGHIMTTVTEAVNNGLFHGNQGDTRKKVSIECELTSRYVLRFIITDEGEGFDFDRNQRSDLDDTLKTYHETGRGIGIFLMKSLSDSFRFLPPGNRLEMTFNI